MRFSPTCAVIATSGVESRLCVDDTEHEIDGARAECRGADTRLAREVAVDVGHEGGALLVPHQDEADLGAGGGNHEADVLFAWNAEHVFHAFRFKAGDDELRDALWVFTHGKISFAGAGLGVTP